MDTMTEPLPLATPPLATDQSERSVEEADQSGASIDLSLLWEMIDRHRLSREQESLSGKHVDTTWELVILQAVLIVLTDRSVSADCALEQL